MRAILINGRICPKEPVPANWPEGAELEIARKKKRARKRTAKSRKAHVDRWMDRVEAMVAKIDPRYDEQLGKAIKAVRAQAKAEARKRMSLE